MVEAMEAYTSGAAHAYGRDDIGVLEEGKLADLIVVDRNIFQVNPENIPDAKVELTMMDGKVVYKKEGEII
jgi:predicted amidohydrolase YtcJ